MKKKNNYLLMIPLFVLAAITCTILGYQWMFLISTDTSSIIALNPQEETVEIISTSENEVATATNTVNATQVTYITENGEFTVSSDDTVWEQYTSINIFNGLEIVAPGDSGEFAYTLANDKICDIEYMMTFDKYEYEEYAIPLTFRLRTAEGNYLGSGEWITADELEDVTSIVSSGDNISYILEWQWVFDTGAEEDNIYDTMLGQNDLLEYTMVITITASGDEEGTVTDLPKTGDDNHIVMLLIILGAAVLGAGIILYIRVRDNKKDDEDEENRKQ